MKNKLFTFLLILGVTTSFGQNIKVYNAYNFSKSFSKDISSSTFSIGEYVNYHKVVDIKFITSLAYSINNLKPNNLEVLSGISVPNLRLTKNVMRSNITLPIGAEVTYKSFGIGASLELLSLGFKNKISASNFVSLPDTISNAVPIGFSTVFSSKDKRNIASKVYLVYTLNDTFSLMFGFNMQKVIYKFIDANDVTYFRAGHKAVAPFVTLRFNVEK